MSIDVLELQNELSSMSVEDAAILRHSETAQRIGQGLCESIQDLLHSANHLRILVTCLRESAVDEATSQEVRALPLLQSSLPVRTPPSTAH